MAKTIPKKKTCKKAKRLSEEALQRAEKRREAKSEGEKEIYAQLNAEFQRIARRDKKSFLREQCQEIGENNRMGKTRYLFKKIGDIEGIFHERMGVIKVRKGRQAWCLCLELLSQTYQVRDLHPLGLAQYIRGRSMKSPALFMFISGLGLDFTLISYSEGISWWLRQ